jgi:hypothetical protein
VPKVFGRPFFTSIAGLTSAPLSMLGYPFPSAHQLTPSSTASLYDGGSQYCWVIPTNCPEPLSHMTIVKHVNIIVYMSFSCLLSQMSIGKRRRSIWHQQQPTHSSLSTTIIHGAHPPTLHHHLMAITAHNAHRPPTTTTAHNNTTTMRHTAMPRHQQNECQRGRHETMRGMTAPLTR